MGLENYPCPLCGWKVKDGGRLFLYDSNVGAIICGECKTKLMKLKRKGKNKSDNIEYYKRKTGNL